ncbi:MAG: DUF2794 domain-containing protein [Pseudomonadota bacterium]|nr:DUF2794 domain-containing protein [Pseudomonadota bacterium]
MSGITSPRKLRKPLFFNRSELGQILATYSGRVACGEWRDYAIDHMPGTAAFSIFRHTHETPLFVIEKQQRHAKESARFILRDRQKTLLKATSLTDIISYFNRLPKLVSSLH